MGIHIIRFRDQATEVRAIGALRNVPVTRVRLPGDANGVASDLHGVTDEHIRALKKAKVPFIYVSKEPDRKRRHGPTVQP
jgi:hypothetical protein